MPETCFGKYLYEMDKEIGVDDISLERQSQ